MAVMSALVFVGIYLVGDPVSMLASPEATDLEREAIRRALGLDQPVWTQYWTFVNEAVRGNFGNSFLTGEPAMRLIIDRMPATLELSLMAALFALLLGVGLGVYTAIRPLGWLSRAIMTVSLIGVSLPTFLIGIALIYLFAVELRWLPSFGRGQTTLVGAWETGLLTRSGWTALILPSIALGLYNMTLIMRLVRAEMLEVLRTDYIRFGRARGLRERDLHFGHALRNTLIPVITIAGLQIGSLVAFAIVTETVFQWPGVGLLFISSIQGVDVPLIAAYLMFIALLYVGINLLVDVLYLAVDPRLRKR